MDDDTLPGVSGVKSSHKFVEASDLRTLFEGFTVNRGNSSIRIIQISGSANQVDNVSLDGYTVNTNAKIDEEIMVDFPELSNSTKLGSQMVTGDGEDQREV